jgi:hypothetical protein
LKIWSNHKFVSWHDVWTLFGVVHFAYMCSTRLISYLYLLCALLVVNPLLNCSNLIKLATMPYFVSFDHFEHLLALVFVDMYTWQHQLEHLFNLLAIILKFLHLCISAFIACFEGVLQSLGSSLISAYVNKGEKFSHSQCHNHPKLRDMHSFEWDCICSGGVALEMLLLDVLSLCLFWRV